MNEAFRGAGGPGGPGGAGSPGGRFGGRGFDGPDSVNAQRENSANAQRESRPRTSPLELDPLIGMDDVDKPLRSKVLAVPSYREKYLANVRKIAEESLDWSNIGPFIQSQANLIDEAVKTETRKLGSYEAFQAAVTTGLKEFADGRRAYLLKSVSNEPR